MMHFDTPLDERMRRAERKRARYRMNPDQRLAAINKKRQREGRPMLASLAESKKLRLPVKSNA